MSVYVYSDGIICIMYITVLYGTVLCYSLVCDTVSVRCVLLQYRKLKMSFLILIENFANENFHRMRKLIFLTQHQNYKKVGGKKGQDGRLLETLSPKR